jgi:hypothetical protein
MQTGRFSTSMRSVFPPSVQASVLLDRLREGFQESRRCPRVTYPESYTTKYTSIQRLFLGGQRSVLLKGVGDRVEVLHSPPYNLHLTTYTLQPTLNTPHPQPWPLRPCTPSHIQRTEMRTGVGGRVEGVGFRALYVGWSTGV